MTSTVRSRAVRWTPHAAALLLAGLIAAQASAQSAPHRLWQVRFDLDHRDDFATVGTFFKRHVVAGGLTWFSPANGGDKLTWLAQWNGESGAPRWSRSVDGIGVPVALEADRKRLFLVGYGRWPLQALSGHDGRTLWESRRGPDLLTLTWLDVALQRRIVYVTGSERALDRPGQVALEARRARDGRLLWSVREPITAAGGGGWDEGRLVAVDGSRLFVAGARTSETGTELGFVSSRRTADGEELWRRESTDYNRLQTMAVAGDRLLLLQSIVGGPGRARVTAVDASSGSQLWSVERGTDLPVRYEPRSAAVSGQVLVVAIDVDGGQGPGQPNDLLFLGLRITDGTELWSDRIRGSYPTGSAGVAAQGTAVVGGGLLFAGGGSGERIFRGYGRATGGRHWELRETPFFAGVLSIAGGRLLAAGSSLGSPRDAIVRVYALPPD